MADDDELIESLLADDDSEDRARTFGLTDWTYERELLTEVVDTLRSLRSVLIAANSKKGKAPKVTPAPRPVTAYERVERRRTQARHEERKRALLPHRG